MKIAVIHDWLVTYAGADRVLEQILECYPDADLFSLVDFLPSNKRKFIKNKRVTTSFIQYLPFSRIHFRKYLPLMPFATEQLDFRGYDLVISSSHSVAKGIITSPDQLHVCFCHSPMRYAWDLQHQYLEEANLTEGVGGWVARWILHNLRTWDVCAANRVDEFIANSEFISRRIWKVYRRRARVIYPPVDVTKFEPNHAKEDYYLTVSRLVPYKRVKLIVEAFSQMPERKLVVIGDGPNYDSIKKIATPNVTMLGFQEGDSVLRYMQRARAFVFAAEEDFGICVAEAQACGTPVIAFAGGGALEIIRPANVEHSTGILFNEQTAEAIIDAVQSFEADSVRFDPEDCRRNVLRFSEQRFREEFRDFCEMAILRKRAETTNPTNEVMALTADSG